MKTIERTTKADDPAHRNAWLQTVWEQVNSLRFRTAQIVVHDARVVKIEKTEHVRLEKSEKANP
jgi:hypothetical protein